MKRLWFAAMLLGIGFVNLQASPSLFAHVENVEFSADIPDDHLCQVFCYAASFYGISEQEAENAYNQGELTVTAVSKNTYRLGYSGGMTVIALEDAL